MCGPTVYDVSHLGHAKTYICFDTIRRLMRDYFKYDVHMVMNITDIDDKIIKKSIEIGEEFTTIARKYEEEFLSDMDNLNVEQPDVLTRVSEYMEEIKLYIAKIIENGYAYESNNSVYFNVKAFAEAPDHRYAKLDPTKVGNKEALKEGEGVLTEDNDAEKRNIQDFALWKKVKEGEPSWGSPWGEGRPGWHIECSAMADAIFQSEEIDLHSGGIDLKFPHHDNEIAQSEAFFGSDNWVKYFLHTGHLNIKSSKTGKSQKMSKSEKNFTTIQDFMTQYNYREMRFLFLLNQWDNVMNYNPEDSLKEARAKDKQFMNFFRGAHAIVKNFDIKKNPQKFSEKDFKLQHLFSEKKDLVHHHLSDNFNTPNAIKELSNLISATSVYMGIENTEIKAPIIKGISKYVLSVLKAMGFVRDDDYAYAVSADSGSEQIAPLMDMLRDFRKEIKGAVRSGVDKKGMFKILDELRNDKLPFLGIKLEDRGEDSVWSAVDREVLIRERQEKIDFAENQQREKEERASAEEALKSTPPTEFYSRWESAKYSQFDEDGIPTHDTAGTELTKEVKNGLKKKLKGHAKKYSKWLAKQDTGAPKEE